LNISMFLKHKNNITFGADPKISSDPNASQNQHNEMISDG